MSLETLQVDPGFKLLVQAFEADLAAMRERTVELLDSR